MKYSVLVYDQAPQGGGYTSPPIPDGYENIVYTSPTWNPFSSNPVDRAQIWANPTLGQYTYFEAYQTAFGFLPLEYQLIDDWYLCYQKVCALLSQPVKTKDECIADMQLNGNMNGVTYDHTNFNVDTEEDWANYFAWGNNNLIRSRNGEVTEYYYSDTEYNGTTYPWVMYDNTTNQPTEYYEYVEGGFAKYSIVDPSQPVVYTYVATHFDDLPVEEQVKLIQFPYKNTIVGYSQKSYGFIVEYRKYGP
jgi:hypothetical protein